MSERIKQRIPLTNGKFAYIEYPSTINKKDIPIFKKAIELMEINIIKQELINAWDRGFTIA